MDINAVADYSKDRVNRNDKLSGIDNLKELPILKILFLKVMKLESPYIIKKFMKLKQLGTL